MGKKSYIGYFVLKRLFHALYLDIKPLKSVLGLWGETLKSKLLKKLSIEIFEILNLSTLTCLIIM